MLKGRNCIIHWHIYRRFVYQEGHLLQEVLWACLSDNWRTHRYQVASQWQGKYNTRNSLLALSCQDQELSPTWLPFRGDFWVLLSLSLSEADLSEETSQTLDSENVLRCMHAFTYIIPTNMTLFTHPDLDQIHKQRNIMPHPAAGYF